jgi:hypothetical protein
VCVCVSDVPPAGHVVTRFIRAGAVGSVGQGTTLQTQVRVWGMSGAGGGLASPEREGTTLRVRVRVRVGCVCMQRVCLYGSGDGVWNCVAL